MQCRNCGSAHIKKNGRSLKGTQRLYCFECKRTFTLELDARRLTKSACAKAVVLRQEGESLRSIASILGYGKTAVWTALKNVPSDSFSGSYTS